MIDKILKNIPISTLIELLIPIIVDAASNYVKLTPQSKDVIRSLAGTDDVKTVLNAAAQVTAEAIKRSRG